MKSINRINGKNINAISLRQGKDHSRLELGVNAISAQLCVITDILALEKVETE